MTLKDRKQFEEDLVKAVDKAKQAEHDALWTSAHPWWQSYLHVGNQKLHDEWRQSWNLYKRTGKIKQHQPSDLKD